MSHIIIGTAGHIDHGKSALVKALTGTDPDRFVEEQKRGMTIDLGFAFLNENIAFIDVPGHEKFIKNMVAGVTTIDMAMLIVAADDGVMPQTREHLDILSLLNLKQGLIAITKIDIVDEEMLELVREDVEELVQGTFLQKAPVLPVSSITGAGLDTLKQQLIDLAAKTEPRPDRGVFWMPVDRSFTMKGFGTVVTGSVLSGSCSVGQSLELLPSKKSLRIRGIQTHGKAVTEAHLGDRAALNLTNIAKDDVTRGEVLATPSYFTPSTLFDVKLNLLKTAPKALANRNRVRVHVGTREVLARVKLLDKDSLNPGESAFVQLLLEQEVVAMRRDPVVIRRYSPPLTIGGGFIIDTNPARHKRFNKEVMQHLQSIEKQNPSEVLVTTLLNSPTAQLSLKELAQTTGFTNEEVLKLLEPLLQSGQILQFGQATKALYFHAINFTRLQDKITHLLADFHAKEPLRPGISKAELSIQSMGKQGSAKLFESALNELTIQNQIEAQAQWIKLKSHKIELSPQDEKLSQSILAELTAKNFSPPSEQELADSIGTKITDIHRILGALLGMEKVVRLEGDIYFPVEKIQQARQTLLTYRTTSEEISVSQFRELLNTSRKYALGLLAYFDNSGLTERVGDVRLINEGER